MMDEEKVGLWDPTSGFFTYEYQRIWLDRQQTLMIDHIEDHACEGASRNRNHKLQWKQSRNKKTLI